MTLRTALLGLIGREPSTAYPSNTDNFLVKVVGCASARGQSFLLVKEVHLYETFFAFQTMGGANIQKKGLRKQVNDCSEIYNDNKSDIISGAEIQIQCQEEVCWTRNEGVITT